MPPGSERELTAAENPGRSSYLPMKPAEAIV